MTLLKPRKHIVNVPLFITRICLSIILSIIVHNYSECRNRSDQLAQKQMLSENSLLFLSQFSLKITQRKVLIHKPRLEECVKTLEKLIPIEKLRKKWLRFSKHLAKFVMNSTSKFLKILTLYSLCIQYIWGSSKSQKH